MVGHKTGQSYGLHFALCDRRSRCRRPAGDPQAAKERIDAIRGLTVLDTNGDIEALADFLLLGGGLPAKARFDALHIACAAYHGMNVVLTWNFKHIANPVQLPVMRGLCAARGYRPPELVSPLEMMEN